MEVNGGMPVLVSLGAGIGVLTLLIIICFVVMCRRRKSVSRSVTIPPPVQRPDLGDHATLLNHPDRLALIAFADGIQAGQVIVFIILLVEIFTVVAKLN